MPNISGAMAARMLARGIRNRIQNKPLSISFEITHACTANCWHCNWGGPIKEERLGAEEYAAICRELRPVVSHASGGEPLARGDVYDIVDAMTNKGGLPWMIVVTNSSNLTPERFFRLKDSGMHQLSTSLDFPDERHDEFRRIPGLFDRMAKVVPEIARQSGDKDDLLLNVCITAWNYRDIGDMVRVAKEWGVPINFSVYTHLRVQDRTGLIEGDGLDGLAESIQEVIDLRNAGYPVYTPPRVLWKFRRFLTEGGIPGCQAGRRFLVINPDGRLTPCAMVMAYFDRQEDMLEKFTKQNTCEQCYISTRANTEKSFREFVQDNSDAFLKILTPWRN
ncbi:radical SAM protein [Candidatus Palauibacter sp.]|uniref:radical SAM protein n=1 Tax=Candidatus Palauibacter sp. TaxID=3101350 RepID=UPI003CC5A9C5